VGHAEFLMYPRSVAQMMAELVATRDSAITERDAYAATLAQNRGDLEEEIRALRAELAGLRPENARLGLRLRQAREDLDLTRESLRTLRRSGRERIRRLVSRDGR